MKHVTYSDKSLLVGDEAADLILEYAAAIANSGRADTVVLRALGVEGNDVEATFLLDSGTIMMAETATTTVEEPDNNEAIRYMNWRLEALRSQSRTSRFSAEDLTDVDHSSYE